MGIATVINREIKHSLFSIFRIFSSSLDFYRLNYQIIEIIEERFSAMEREGTEFVPDHFEIRINPDKYSKKSHQIENILNKLERSITDYAVKRHIPLRNPVITVTFIPDAKVPTRSVEIECIISSADDVMTIIGETSCFVFGLDGDLRDRKWPVKSGGKLTIGRSRYSDIQIKDWIISREHAVLEIDSEGRIFLCDTGSKNGTYINEEKEPLRGRRRIFIGDIFRLGKKPAYRFRIEKS